MLSTQGYAAMTAKAALQLFSFERREVGPQDVLITITHCGICHSDIHQARDEWGGSIFPMVPGHEIAVVTRVGSAVKLSKSANAPESAASSIPAGPVLLSEGSEQYCEAGMLLTYSGRDKDGQLRKAVTPRRLSWMRLRAADSRLALISWGRPLVVCGHHDLLSASPLGRRQVSQACSGGIGWTGPYGCEDRQGARNRSNCLEHL